MVLVDISEHNLTVVKGALATLQKVAAIPDQKQELIMAYEDIYTQLSEVDCWQIFRKWLDQEDSEAIDNTLTLGLNFILKSIGSLEVTPDVKEQLKSISFRIELKLGENPKIVGLIGG